MLMSILIIYVLTYTSGRKRTQNERETSHLFCLTLDQFSKELMMSMMSKIINTL